MRKERNLCQPRERLPKLSARFKIRETQSRKQSGTSASERLAAGTLKKDTVCLEGCSLAPSPSCSLFRFYLSFFSFFRFFIFTRVFSATPRSSPGTREIFVRIKAPGINIPRSREGVGCERTRVTGGSVVGRAGGGPGGCVRASLARETTGALPLLRLPAPSPPHLSKLTPFLSFSRPAHSFFVLLSLVLSSSCSSSFLYPVLPRPFGTSTALESRSFSSVSDSRDPLLSYTRRRSPS